MLELDGSGGGGQLVRTALTCAALSGEPFTMTGIRGARSNPGLRPQHLAAVRLAAAVADADVEGAEQGSERLAFDPGACSGGEYEVDIGTAGSVALVLDVVLPLATHLDEPVRVTVSGGTAVRWAPPLATYRHVKLPLLRRFGLGAALDVGRPGYYPVGGGRATLTLHPSDLDPLALAERGDARAARVYSAASSDLAEAGVATRQAAAAADRLRDAGWSVTERTTTAASADSAGSSVCVRLDYEQSLAGFDALGEKDKPAAEVGEEAASAAVAFSRAEGAVDEHLADQLLVFLALAGGRVDLPAVTDHVESNADLLRQFGYDVQIEDGVAVGRADRNAQ